VADSDGGMPDLAERLDHLFRTVPRPGGRGLWSNEQASIELARQGTAMSAAYLSQLRNGKRDNPSARHLNALASLFAVPISYFFDADTADKINNDLRLLSAIRDSDVQAIALRAHGISPEGLASVRGIIDHIRRVEQLPDEGDSADAVEQDPPSGPE
jgi:transcriptional regulator with XRE-family HTH domain